MKYKKFTFKKEPRSTGLAGIGERGLTNIKLDKKEVGYIRERSGDYKWYICLAIKKEKTKDSPAPFRWISLQEIFYKENDARQWLNDHKDDIQEKYDLYKFED